MKDKYIKDLLEINRLEDDLKSKMSSLFIKYRREVIKHGLASKKAQTIISVGANSKHHE